MILKRATLLALTLGTIGLMAEAEVESGLLPIPIPSQSDSLAVKAVEVAQVQGKTDTAENTNKVEKKELQVEEKVSKRIEPSNEPQRNDEPRQPDAVAKPNFPANSPAPPKQMTEAPRAKPSFKRGNQSKEEEIEEPDEKSQLKNKKNKNKNDNDNDNGPDEMPRKTNYTVPKRRSQSQQNGGMEESVPGSVIGALVLFLVVALMQ